ncbi:hypothetical protein TTHERM_00627240 (macronuclear) [Tetrahymena thermophila SB210]|uniref:Uncharacterized protein n=1 Tax=Tetrahymena thermophila (strain SB210) TaxID=312017 RepID=Q23RX5_TETTS|nr:hypothetical protein TTHERM_00627240 [Tetrahymena thermophila SB210]EAR99264.2 hypothetical protein TTHERM_00627240 [Tetrahymena thermophila SB210]|eukprot:XP_001019509.2 hypothetical protein TTHERM_00627240 [Tetrahymena thermophila SB210]
MRSSVSNSSSVQPPHQHLERMYELLIGQTLDVETQLIGTLLSKSGNLEKQIEDIQVIMNQLRLKILQNSLSVIENIVSSKDASQSYLDFKRIVDENSEKYRQIQIFNQMKSILNQKIVAKIEILNNQAQNNEELRTQVLADLESLNNNLEKVDKALQRFQSIQEIHPFATGFSVLKDLQQSQQYENFLQYDTQRSYTYGENSIAKDKLQIHEQKFSNKNNHNENQDADDEIEESNIYADEAVSMNEITQSNLYATQDLNLNQMQNQNNNISHNNQSYQSYQKPRVDDLHHSNLKLITPVVQKLNSIGYKTEPDSAMTPLHSADMIKTSMYKTPSDNNNNNNNKKLFKNNLNAIYQSNFDSHDINQIINSDTGENEEQNSYIPPSLQIQGSETVSAGDLISPQVTNNNERTIGCTSFNKSIESSSQNYSTQFDAASETKNENNILTFGNNNNLLNNLKTDQNSVFNSKTQNYQKNNKNQQQQNKEDEAQQNKLIDMFDACLNSLQQPDLITMKRYKDQLEAQKKIVEEEEKQSDSIDEFVLHEKEISQNIYLKNQNEQKQQIQEEQESIKFNGVNISNVHEIEECKGDNSFFSQKDFSMTHTNYNTEKDKKKENAAQNQEPKFISTFGLNQSTEDPQAAYLEQKFGKEHFDIDQFSYEKELEDKINSLKKQLFSNETLGSFAKITGNFNNNENLLQIKSNVDTIKPVITRKDELEALGIKEGPEAEQFQIVEESPEFQLQDDNNNDSNNNSINKKVSQQENSQNSKKLFEESNRFYQTLDEDTLKEIQQQRYQKSEELQLNNQIGEEEEEENQEQENELQKLQDSTQKDDEENTSIPRSTLAENQFIQPANKEIPNYADQYENLVNQFLSKPNNFSQELQIKNDKKQSVFDQINSQQQQNKQQKLQKPNFENTFGIDLKELSLNNSKKSSQVQSDQQELSKKQSVNESIQEEEEAKKNDTQSQQILQNDFIRQKEYTKCRIFEVNDFLKNSNYNSNESNKDNLQDSLKQKQEPVQQNKLTSKLVNQLQAKNKVNERYSEKTQEINSNQEQEQGEEDNDFERDETPSFLDEFKNNMANKKPKNKMYQNFMQDIENTNLQTKNQKIFQNKAINSYESNESQIKQQEFLKTAHFESSEKFLNERLEREQLSKKNIKNQVPQQLPVEEESEYQDNDEELEQEEVGEESKQQNEEQNHVLEEPIESLMEDYPMLFQNAQLQQLVSQQKQKQDLAKTTKLSQRPKQMQLNTPQQNLKKSNNTIENKSNNTINNVNKINAGQTIQSQQNTGAKKIPPKKPVVNSNTQNNTASKPNLNHKSNNSLTQLNSGITQTAATEKENYKSLQNSEIKQNPSEISEQSEQVNLQRTLKNTKPKIGIAAAEKPKIRSSSIKNDDEESQNKKPTKTNLPPPSNKQQQIQSQEQPQLKDDKEDQQKLNPGLNKVKSSQNFSGKKIVNSCAVVNKKLQ